MEKEANIKTHNSEDNFAHLNVVKLKGNVTFLQILKNAHFSFHFNLTEDVHSLNKPMINYFFFASQNLIFCSVKR